LLFYCLGFTLKNMDTSTLSYTLSFIGTGIGLSLSLLLGAVFIGCLVGFIIALLQHLNYGRFFLRAFISVIRGTPMILQLSLVYFALPSLIHCPLSLLQAGIITLGLNSSAYMAEIFRAGIAGIPKGQFEAAQTLNIPRWPLWKDIILPQVFRLVFPAFMNETITLFKDTALISTIGGLDIMRRAQMVAAEQFTYFMPLCIAACYYYVLVLLFEWIAYRIEKGWTYAQN
jgi:polar amino acid transport system permease protein